MQARKAQTRAPGQTAAMVLSLALAIPLTQAMVFLPCRDVTLFMVLILALPLTRAMAFAAREKRP